jgi:hypothetical protein
MTDSLFISQLPAEFAALRNDVQRRLLAEYGSMFVARGGAVVPRSVVFQNQSEVEEFQADLDIASAHIGGFDLELQAFAMGALLAAIAEAKSKGLTITPRSGDSARRDYAMTVELWASRVEPALNHWTKEGKLDAAVADRIRALSPDAQVPEVFALEEQGIYFAKDLSKSIIYSVAPAGASQHLAMLAFDVSEFGDPEVRKILADHYWYQTVVSDLPHFTFLGVDESELTDLGLKKVVNGEFQFWVPDI